MKNSLIFAIALMTALSCLRPAWAQQLTVSQLPPAVRQTVNTETKNGPVQKIVRMTKDGRTIYDVTFQQQNGSVKDIYLEENGSYVPAQASTPTPTIANAAKRPLTINDVPEPVRREINTEAANGPIKRIQQRPYNGRDIYEVAFQKTDGTEKLIYLNVDGSYVQDKPAVGGAAVVETEAGSNRTQLSTASKVAFGQLPAVVQNAIRAQAGSATIEDVDKGILNGKTVYEAAFKQGERTVELRVDDRGNVIPDVADRLILARGALTGATQINLGQVPAAVQTAMKAQAGNVALEQVQKGTINGKTIYQGLYHSNGQLMQVRVNENGRLIQAPITVNP